MGAALGGQTDAELLNEAAVRAALRGDLAAADFFSTAAADHEQGVCGSPGADCYAVTSARDTLARYEAEGGAR